MSTFRLCAWEENGYNDSDFMEAHYNSETNTTEVVEVGSTRYAGLGAESMAKLALVKPLSCAPLSVVDAIRMGLVARIHASLVAAEEADCLPSHALPQGYRVRLLRNVKHKGQTFLKGLCGTVFWCGAFGQFYSNGYNRPNRSNLRCGVSFDDGSKGYVAMSACEREAPAMSDVELLKRAVAISWTPNVGKCFGCRAWLSSDYLTPRLIELKASQAQPA